jgi:hypothetical protein
MFQEEEKKLIADRSFALECFGMLVGPRSSSQHCPRRPSFAPERAARFHFWTLCKFL